GREADRLASRRRPAAVFRVRSRFACFGSKVMDLVVAIEQDAYAGIDGRAAQALVPRLIEAVELEIHRIFGRARVRRSEAERWLGRVEVAPVAFERPAVARRVEVRLELEADLPREGITATQRSGRDARVLRIAEPAAERDGRAHVGAVRRVVADARQQREREAALRLRDQLGTWR